MDKGVKTIFDKCKRALKVLSGSVIVARSTPTKWEEDPCKNDGYTPLPLTLGGGGTTLQYPIE